VGAFITFNSAVSLEACDPGDAGAVLELTPSVRAYVKVDDIGFAEMVRKIKHIKCVR
jgi:hypothetical protein